MKALLSSIALSMSFLVLCISLFLGVRIGPSLWRALVIFAAAYGCGLVLALVTFMAYLSAPKQTHSTGNKKLKETPIAQS